ncbi:MAG: hypothetical protein PHI97_02315 [Desulfobulbus sp.]|nr:hypothetical protein [Desulfobulbus sp.]
MVKQFRMFCGSMYGIANKYKIKRNNHGVSTIDILAGVALVGIVMLDILFNLKAHDFFMSRNRFNPGTVKMVITTANK